MQISLSERDVILMYFLAILHFQGHAYQSMRNGISKGAYGPMESQ